MKSLFKKIFVILSLSLCFILSGVLCIACTEEDDDEIHSVITLNASTITVSIDSTYALRATVEDPDGDLKWEISDNTVAEISKLGVVTGKKVGNTTVTVSNNSASAKCTVTVTTGDVAPQLTFKGQEDGTTQFTAKSLSVGQRYTVEPYVIYNGKNYEDLTVTYTVDNGEIGEMNGNTFIAKKKGTATVKATATWRNAEAKSLTQYLTFNVLDTEYIRINEGSFVNDVITLGIKVDGVESSYSNTFALSFEYLLNGKVISADQSKFTITVEDNEVVTLNTLENRVTARLFGETILTVTYTEGEVTYSQNIKVVIARPIVETNKYVQYLSSQGNFNLESITGNANLKVVEAYQDGQELLVKDGAIVAFNHNGKDGVKTSDIIIYTDNKAGYTFSANVYPFVVENYEDFKKISNFKDSYVILKNNIYADDTVFNTIDVLTGTIDGNGFAVYNLVVQGGDTSDSTFNRYGGGLVANYYAGSKLCNIAFINMRTKDGDDTKQSFLGGHNYSSSSDNKNKGAIENVYVHTNMKTVDGLTRTKNCAIFGTAIAYLKLTNVVLDYPSIELNEANAYGISAKAGTSLGSVSGYGMFLYYANSGQLTLNKWQNVIIVTKSINGNPMPLSSMYVSRNANSYEDNMYTQQSNLTLTIGDYINAVYAANDYENLTVSTVNYVSSDYIFDYYRPIDQNKDGVINDNDCYYYEDTNGDGKLTVNSPDERVDQNGDGKITADDKIDSNGDGVIDAKDKYEYSQTAEKYKIDATVYYPQYNYSIDENGKVVLQLAQKTLLTSTDLNNVTQLLDEDGKAIQFTNSVLPQDVLDFSSVESTNFNTTLSASSTVGVAKFSSRLLRYDSLGDLKDVVSLKSFSNSNWDVNAGYPLWNSDEGNNLVVKYKKQGDAEYTEVGYDVITLAKESTYEFVGEFNGQAVELSIENFTNYDNFDINKEDATVFVKDVGGKYIILKISYKVNGQQYFRYITVTTSLPAGEYTYDGVLEYSSKNGKFFTRSGNNFTEVTLADIFGSDVVINSAKVDDTVVTIRNNLPVEYMPELDTPATDVITGKTMVITSSDVTFNIPINVYAGIITTEEEFKMLNVAGPSIKITGYFVLGADIDVQSATAVNQHFDYYKDSDVRSYDKSKNKVFTEFGFHGTFDGLGHHISNYHIMLGYVYTSGVFPFLGDNSTIKNLSLINIRYNSALLKSNNGVNAIFGYAMPSYFTLENVYIHLNDEFENRAQSCGVCLFQGISNTGSELKNVIINMPSPSDEAGTYFGWGISTRWTMKTLYFRNGVQIDKPEGYTSGDAAFSDVVTAQVPTNLNLYAGKNIVMITRPNRTNNRIMPVCNYAFNLNSYTGNETNPNDSAIVYIMGKNFMPEVQDTVLNSITPIKVGTFDLLEIKAVNLYTPKIDGKFSLTGGQSIAEERLATTDYHLFYRSEIYTYTSLAELKDAAEFGGQIGSWKIDEQSVTWNPQA